MRRLIENFTSRETIKMSLLLRYPSRISLSLHHQQHQHQSSAFSSSFTFLPGLQSSLRLIRNSSIIHINILFSPISRDHHSKTVKMFSKIFLIALAASPLVAAHGKIAVATGDAGGNSTALGIQGGVIPGAGKNKVTEPDTTVFKGDQADACGRTNGVSTPTSYPLQLSTEKQHILTPFTARRQRHRVRHPGRHGSLRKHSRPGHPRRLRLRHSAHRHLRRRRPIQGHAQHRRHWPDLDTDGG